MGRLRRALRWYAFKTADMLFFDALLIGAVVLVCCYRVGPTFTLLT